MFKIISILFLLHSTTRILALPSPPSPNTNLAPRGHTWSSSCKPGRPNDLESWISANIPPDSPGRACFGVSSVVNRCVKSKAKETVKKRLKNLLVEMNDEVLGAVAARTAIPEEALIIDPIRFQKAIRGATQNEQQCLAIHYNVPLPTLQDASYSSPPAR